MENLKGPALPESQRSASGVLRPIIHLLRASGIEASAVRSAAEQAFSRYAKVRARGLSPPGEGSRALADVVRIWVRDPEFIDARGAPARLPLGRGPGSFASLVRRARAPLSPSRALEGLLALGSVQRCDRRRRVRLLSSEPFGTRRTLLGAPMLDAMRHFAETMEHNFCGEPLRRGHRLCRWTACRMLDARELEEVERFVASSGLSLLDAVTDKLHASARPDSKHTLEYGVGLYVFIDQPNSRALGRARRRRERRGT
ncbi:MAG: DUF6502 family protein [Steroidobacteraceae bacterium]